MVDAQSYKSPSISPRDAAAALIKRLAHRNANVQLYTLELANAFSQNCGPKMHRELASRSFTDALLRLANDRVLLRLPFTSYSNQTDSSCLSIEHACYCQIQDSGTHG